MESENTITFKVTGAEREERPLTIEEMDSVIYELSSNPHVVNIPGVGEIQLSVNSFTLSQAALAELYTDPLQFTFMHPNSLVANSKDSIEVLWKDPSREEKIVRRFILGMHIQTVDQLVVFAGMSLRGEKFALFGPQRIQIIINALRNYDNVLIRQQATSSEL